MTRGRARGGAGRRPGVVHHVQPAAISLTQATESGTVYRPDEMAAIARGAAAPRPALHMDGARFANALAFAEADARPRSPGAPASTCSPSAPPRTARWRPRRWCSSTRRWPQEFAFRRKRGGPSLLQDALPLGPARGLSRRRSLAPERPPRQRHGQAPGRGAGGAAGRAARPPGRGQRDLRRAARDVPSAASRPTASTSIAGWARTRPLLRLVTAFNTKPADVEAFIASAERHAAKANEKVA